MRREKSKWRTHEGERTDAGPRDGATRRSGEVGETRWSEGVASSSLWRRSTARAGGAVEPSEVVQYFQEGGGGGVPPGEGEWRSRRGGCGKYRGVRRGSEEQPLQDLESHVVGDVLPTSGASGGHSEEGRRGEAAGHPDRWGSGRSDRRQAVPGAGGGAALPP